MLLKVYLIKPGIQAWLKTLLTDWNMGRLRGECLKTASGKKWLTNHLNNKAIRVPCPTDVGQAGNFVRATFHISWNFLKRLLNNE